MTLYDMFAYIGEGFSGRGRLDTNSVGADVVFSSIPKQALGNSQTIATQFPKPLLGAFAVPTSGPVHSRGFAPRPLDQHIAGSLSKNGGTNQRWWTTLNSTRDKGVSFHSHALHRVWNSWLQDGQMKWLD